MIYIKNTVKPVHSNKINEHFCWMYNNRGSFWDIYKNPSKRKQFIYNRICDEADFFNHSRIHCAGSSQTFSAYYVYKEQDKYYLRCITPGAVRIIEVIVEEVHG